MKEILDEYFSMINDGKINTLLNFKGREKKIERFDVMKCILNHPERKCNAGCVSIDKSNPWQQYYLTDSEVYDSVSSGNHSENDEVNQLRKLKIKDYEA